MITLSRSALHPYTIQFLKAIVDAGGGTLLPVEVDAVNNLVEDLTSYGMWNKLVALFPYVGRSAIPCSFNLINPLQFRTEWFGGVTFGGLGITGNQTDAYGRMPLLTVDRLGSTTNHYFAGYMIGNENGGGGAANIRNMISSITSGSGVYLSAAFGATDPAPRGFGAWGADSAWPGSRTSNGLYAISKGGSNNYTLYYNDLSEQSGSFTSNGGGNTFNVLNGNPDITAWTITTLAISIFGQGMTITEAVFISRSISKYVAELRRNV